MDKTCANHASAVPFLYWSGGKPFRSDVKASPCQPSLDVLEKICELAPSRSSVFFWLCQNCFSTVILRFDQHQRLAVLPPLRSGERVSRPTELKREQEYSAPPLLSRGQASPIGVVCYPMEGGR
jgi:hypothetical protein